MRITAMVLLLALANLDRVACVIAEVHVELGCNDY
jgi:hypothetical protein